MLDKYYGGEKDSLTRKILGIKPTEETAVRYAPATKYTPEVITELSPNEIFVFGSNLAGMHGSGAARAALNRFGAIWGRGVGLQGQSYAIPTMHGGVDTIKPYVDEFAAFARSHPELTFYVTRIGCGIAGFTDAEIAPLFRNVIEVENVLLPESFVICLVENGNDNLK